MRATFPFSWLTGLLLTALWLPTSAQAAQLHQIIAGVSKHSAFAGQKDLRLAHQDARDMAAFWKGIGSRIFTRTTGDALLDDQATRNNILRRLDQAVAEAQTGDWVVIFLAGHGGPHRLFPRDPEWSFSTHDDVISGSELKQRIKTLAQRKVMVLLIIDSCHSGKMAVPETNAIVMAACKDNEVSQESRDLGNGYFTHALLKALRGGAATRDGQLTLTAVRSFVTSQVSHARPGQNPVFSIPPGLETDVDLLNPVLRAEPGQPQRHRDEESKRRDV